MITAVDTCCVLPNPLNFYVEIKQWTRIQDYVILASMLTYASYASIATSNTTVLGIHWTNRHCYVE